PFPITCHLMGINIPIKKDIHKRLSVYFQLFMIFGYKLVKDSEEYVNYPGLPSSKYYANAQKYLKKGAGGVLTFRLKGAPERADQLIDHVKLLSHLANIGDAKSLIIHPSATTHEQLSIEEQKASGVAPGLVRLSVGIEHIEDIKADLEQALAQIK
ncbi:MAG: PLP-dependent transferase, partial [Bacteroidales bacterium]